MKKLIALLMTAALIMAVFAGCSNKANKDDSKTPDTSGTQQVEQTQTEKALALINTFASGDTETAKNLLAEGYIQHNLAYGTGRDAFIGSVEYLASAETKTTVKNIRAFEDGDKVF